MTRQKDIREKKITNISDERASNLPRLPKLPNIRTDMTNAGRLDSHTEFTEDDPNSTRCNNEHFDFVQERQRAAEKVRRRYKIDKLLEEFRESPDRNKKNHYPVDNDTIHVTLSNGFGNSSYQEDGMPYLNSAERELELDKKRQSILERKDREVKYFRKCKKMKTEANNMPSDLKQEIKKVKKKTKASNKSREEDNFLVYDISEDPTWQRHIPMHDNYTQLPPSNYHILPPINEHQHVNRQTVSIPIDVDDESSGSECCDVELDKVKMSGHSEIVLKDEQLRQELKLDLSFTKTPVPRRAANKSSKQSKHGDGNKTTRRERNRSERL